MGPFQPKRTMSEDWSSPMSPQHANCLTSKLYPQQEPEDITQWDNPFYTLAASFHNQKPPNPWKDHATKQLENVLLVRTTYGEKLM